MIKINCKTQETLNISELTEFQGDLKHRDENDISKIIKSIKKHGFAFPFFVWKHDGINHVFDGHGRLLALKQMEQDGETIPELPVVYINAENEAEAKEMLLKLNSNYGHMTTDSVMEFLDGINIDFDDIQLPDTELNFNIDDEEIESDDDDAPAAEEKAVSKVGEVYQLGKHKLMCGDSTNAEDVAKLMNGVKADMVLTDPPYNVDYTGKTKESLKIKNDKMSDDVFINFLSKVFTNINSYLKSGGVFYIWYSYWKQTEFETGLKEAKLRVSQILIWVKNCLVLSHLDYQPKQEPCFYGWKEGSGHYWDGRRDLSNVIDNKPNYKKMNKDQLLEEIKKLRGEDKPTTIIYEDKPTKSVEHPTMKPVNLFKRLIKNSSKEEDVVLDLFGGSGTTIIAAEKINRTAYVMEYDPSYCDVIRKRWTKYAKENNLEIGSGGLN